MTAQKRRRVPFRLLVTAAAALALMLALVPPVAAQEDVTPARVAGEDRYQTAAEIARLDFDAAHDAFIASAENFPDALAVSFAAGQAGAEDGPILLTRQGSLPHATRQALADLDVERVFIIGGPAAVHPDVAAELATDGYEVVRIEGANRYETAASVAFAWGMGPHGDVGTLDGDRTALLASGARFPDALTAGPVAASAQFPLLLTPADSTHPAVDETLTDLEIERIVVIGGDAAVSSDVVIHYQEAGFAVERWAGANRRETAGVVADNAVERLGYDASLTLLARGDFFPDALAASVHGGLHAAPMLLTQEPNALGAETRQWLLEQCPAIEAVRALGGTAAISTAVLGDAVAAAGECLEAPPNNRRAGAVPLRGGHP